VDAVLSGNQLTHATETLELAKENVSKEGLLSILNRLNRLNGPNISSDLGYPFGGDDNRTDILNLKSSVGCANKTEVVCHF